MQESGVALRIVRWHVAFVTPEDVDAIPRQWRSRQSRQQQNLGLRAPWGPEQGNGADEQTFTPQTTAVSNTMTTSETHEPQTTTEPDRIATVGTTARRR